MCTVRLLAAQLAPRHMYLTDLLTCAHIVEACLKQESVADYEQVRAAVAEYLDITCTFLTRGS